MPRNGEETIYNLDQNNHTPDCDISWFCLTPTIESRMLPKTSQHHSVFLPNHYSLISVECIWNVMAHAQKTDFVFRRNRRVHLNRHGRRFSRLLGAEVCASAVIMLDTPCSAVVWRVLAIHSIRQFPRHFPSRAPPCAITFQLDSTTGGHVTWSNLE